MFAIPDGWVVRSVLGTQRMGDAPSAHGTEWRKTRPCQGVITWRAGPVGDDSSGIPLGAIPRRCASEQRSIRVGIRQQTCYG